MAFFGENSQCAQAWKAGVCVGCCRFFWRRRCYGQNDWPGGGETIQNRVKSVEIQENFRRQYQHTPEEWRVTGVTLLHALQRLASILILGESTLWMYTENFEQKDNWIYSGDNIKFMIELMFYFYCWFDHSISFHVSCCPCNHEVVWCSWHPRVLVISWSVRSLHLPRISYREESEDSEAGRRKQDSAAFSQLSWIDPWNIMEFSIYSWFPLL